MHLLLFIYSNAGIQGKTYVCSFGFAHLKKDLHTLLIVVVLTLLSDFRLVTSFLFILY